MEKNIFNSNIKTSFATDIDKPKFAISEEHSKKYKDILEATDIKEDIKEFFYENIKVPDLLDIDPDQADVQITYLKSISKGEFSYGTDKFNYILKTEYTGDLQIVNVFQLKINGKNIDLN